MPPRPPLKPAATRSGTRRVAARRTAPAKAATALAEVAATLMAPPRRPASSAAHSPYPDLSMAIHMLEVSLRHATAEKQQLLQKWVGTLTRLQTEMQALHRLENLKNRLNSLSETDASAST